mmetsp:Transcript_48653/g.95379  ORF Transcript_48653/g.95379 Transcript_48653/m.95379 type:complete len:163 (+) Transcript_48653:45-533(+)
MSQGTYTHSLSLSHCSGFAYPFQILFYERLSKQTFKILNASEVSASVVLPFRLLFMAIRSSFSTTTPSWVHYLCFYQSAHEEIVVRGLLVVVDQEHLFLHFLKSHVVSLRDNKVRFALLLQLLLHTAQNLRRRRVIFDVRKDQIPSRLTHGRVVTLIETQQR